MVFDKMELNFFQIIKLMQEAVYQERIRHKRPIYRMQHCFQAHGEEKTDYGQWRSPDQKLLAN